MTNTAQAERLFQGTIGQEYELLKIICPEAADMSQRVAAAVGQYRQQQHQTPGDTLQILELGCGTGITSLALLSQDDGNRVTGIDNAATMLDQAKTHLTQCLGNGRLALHETDALSYLRACTDDSVAVIVSAYTLHNFLDTYRADVLAEIYRVLKPGGLFVNGDRYALDDVSEHTRMTQAEVQQYFERIRPCGRYDILEKWLVHLFSDESENHIMRTGKTLAQMQQLGFSPVSLQYRQAVNALVVAGKA